jgi:hypothetical protein
MPENRNGPAARARTRGLAEEGAEADGHDGRNRAVAEDDLVDRARCHANGASHGVLGNPHRGEVFLQQDFAGCELAINFEDFGLHGTGILTR